MSRAADRDPAVEARIRNTGLFLVYVVATLFFASTSFILYRWWAR